jgi:hypothetical protein
MTPPPLPPPWLPPLPLLLVPFQERSQQTRPCHNQPGQLYLQHG